MQNIRNLLFDLGDVLYAIDFHKSLDAWQAMAPHGQESVLYSKETQHEQFSLLETGKIDIDTFADGLIREYKLNGTREAVIRGWEDLLLGVIPGRLEAIKRLAPHYRMALLSNTNYHHYTVYKDECAPLFAYFDHVFYSFEMGMRKPDHEIYEAVLEQTGWKGEETLFLDDSPPNIVSAKEVGLQAALIAEHADFDRVVAQLPVPQ
jgi:HAD superfamily hydrolase (TIGR01509 family)